MKKKLFFNKKSKLVYLEAFVITCLCMLLGIPLLNADLGMGTCYYEVSVAGKFVGSVKDPGVVEQAFLDARAQVSRETNGLVLSEVGYSMERIEKILGVTMDTETLTRAIYEELQKDVVTARKKGYLIKIDEFTLNIRSYQEVMDILNATKAKFDPEDEFEVRIVAEADRELNVYTAEVVRRDLSEELKQNEEMNSASGGLSEAYLPVVADLIPQAGIAAYDLLPLLDDIVTATVTEEFLKEDQKQEDDLTEVRGDGLRLLYFGQKVEIVEAYVSEDQFTPVEQAIELVTKDQEKNQVYEVKSGDSLSVIANSHDMMLKELLALNEGLTENTILSIGDEIVITIPEPELSMTTVEESTYEEDYYAEPEYILNDEWYTTQKVVRQKGVPGHHVVTALITRENNKETERRIIAETVTAEPVVEIIEKGTKVPPTYVKPLSGGRFTSGYKWRWGRQHKGVDWACPIGTAIMASSGGKVVQAGWSSGYGYCITLSHPDGRRTRYAHLSKILVSVGQSVAQGQKIALSGNTGRSTGPHVHFEIIINGSQVDPMKYLN